MNKTAVIVIVILVIILISVIGVLNYYFNKPYQEPKDDNIQDTNCQVSDWITDGGCSKQCGGGFQKYKRTVIKQANDCPELTKTENCNTDPCVFKLSKNLTGNFNWFGNNIDKQKIHSDVFPENGVISQVKIVFDAIIQKTFWSCNKNNVSLVITDNEFNEVYKSSDIPINRIETSENYEEINKTFSDLNVPVRKGIYYNFWLKPKDGLGNCGLSIKSKFLQVDELII